MNPSHTETLLALGLGPSIVGISDFCPAVDGASRLGSLYAPSLESIALLKPDRVFTVLREDHATPRRLRDLGIPVVSLDPQSLEEVIEAVLRIGEEAGAADAARALAGGLRARLEGILRRARARGKGPRVFVEVQASPLWTVGPGSFLDEALLALGAENCFPDLSHPYATVSPEEVLRRNPEVVVSLHAKAAEIRARPGWEGVAAVRAGAIVDEFASGALAHGSPRLFDEIERLEERLFPPEGASR
ncbi:MAG TPA: helical backbone metal receptor [Planctomycetota bacterium]|nr:helical backbone metal receptor [Planctomycetota bacterium]